MVLRGTRNHQFAVILLVKLGTLGDISVKQAARHVETVCSQAFGIWPGRTGWGPLPGNSTQVKPKSTQLRPVFKEANNLPHPNYSNPNKLPPQPRDPRQSTRSAVAPNEQDEAP